MEENMRKTGLKKCAVTMISMVCTVGMLMGCGAQNGTQNPAGANNASNSGVAAADTKLGEITVVSREDGSGTRGAFIELLGIEQKDASGKKVDHTTDEAQITNSTEVMMTTVAGSKATIGYTSLGSLNESVKALKVDGKEATAANVKNGTYTVSRPFNIATKGEVSDVAKDFISYIMSAEGQKIVEDKGYISQGNQGAFKSNNSPKGKVVVAGSSSVTPVMEKLSEGYMKVNKDAVIEIQQSDSSTGMTAAISGTCDIGMASRALKDSETGAGLKSQTIAIDGIAVIVNKQNPLDNITKDQVKDIFMGNVTDWSNVK